MRLPYRSTLIASLLALVALVAAVPLVAAVWLWRMAARPWPGLVETRAGVVLR